MNKTLLAVLVLLIVLAGGYFLLSNLGGPGGQMATTTPSAMPEPTPTPTSPTPTPEPQVDAPTVVTDQNVTPSESTAVVTGRVTPNGAPTAYWYEYGATTALGQRTTAQAIGSGFTAIPSPGYITGLQVNTTYYFRLSAKNIIGTTNGTTYSFQTNTTPPPHVTPPIVSTGGATDIDRTVATLNATVNPNGSPTTFWFEYGLNTDLGRVTSLQEAGSGSGGVPASAALTDLNPQTKYFYRINASNEFGTVNGAIRSFTTMGPASPGVPTVDTTSATKVSTSSAQLNGRITPNGAETTYWFEYGTTPLLTSILGTATADQKISADATTLTVSANVTGLDSNTRYYYRLVARNSFGTVRGDIVNFRTAR